MSTNTLPKEAIDKINQVKNNYNSYVSQLTNNYNKLIAIILNSKISNRIVLVNNTIKEYNNKLYLLKQQMNNEINKIIKEYTTTTTNSSKKNALLIGINYIGSEYELNGCINDTSSINNFLSSCNYKNIKIITDQTVEKPTRNNIINNLTNLLNTAGSGDVIFFFYSGHGSQMKDTNNNEFTGNDQMIVPCDFNIILDDELKSIINKNLKNNVTLIALFDSCFSESVLDLKYQYLDSLNNNNNSQNNKETETNGNVIMISGCSDIQTSTDAFINGKNQGALTWAFLQTLNNNKNLTWRQLLIEMRNLLKNSSFSQIPQLASGKSIDIDKQIII
jgi:hypothetical protein